MIAPNRVGTSALLIVFRFLTQSRRGDGAIGRQPAENFAGRSYQPPGKLLRLPADAARSIHRVAVLDNRPLLEKIPAGVAQKGIDLAAFVGIARKAGFVIRRV